MLELMQQLAGTNNILKWITKEKDQMHVFYRKITDYIYATIDYMIDRYGAENITVLDTYQLDNDTMFSRDIFEEMSLPYIVDLHDRYDKTGLGGWILHLCGDHRKSLHYWLEDIKLLPRTVFYIGTEMDIVKTAKTIGDEYVIAGNLPNPLIQTGTPLELHDYTRDLVLKMKNNLGGFMLMPDCVLTPNAPIGNLFVIIETAKKYGRFDD